MSVLGTGVAAGVAQTGLQAQQAARQRDKINERPARDEKRVRETEEDRLLTLNNQDDQAGADQIQISGQLPRYQNQQSVGEQQAKVPVDEATGSEERNSDDDGLYRHVDMKA